MAGVNKVILLGNLGKDPEVRVFEGGTKKAAFSLATGETFLDKNGQRQERTEWHNVVFWGNIVDVIEKYLKKGTQVYVEGRITTRSYDDKDGQKKYITEIVGTSMTLLGGKPTGGGENNDASYQGTTNSRPETSSQSVNSSILADGADDLPF
ncbi:MAG TPA: single-stranded DNA-binding protein [Cytophagaceae bacterium]|jgi:single-strand DNA-binding protein|nr:single-stranded DNA-binding protein [Cytophagaceae bacterium]